MPDVQYQKLVLYDAIEDEVWITQDRHAPMSSVVHQPADLREKTQSIDGGFNGAKYVDCTDGITFDEISRDTLEIT